MYGKRKGARYNADTNQLKSIAEREILNLHGMFHDKTTLLDEYMDFFADMQDIPPDELFKDIKKDAGLSRPLENFWMKKYDGDMKNKEDFMDFAKNTLTNKVIGAVDGSQIYPHYILTIPVGLIRVYGVNISYDGKTPPFELDQYRGVNPYQDPGVKDMKEYHYELHRSTVDYFRNEMEHYMECKLILQQPDYVFTDNPLILSFLELGHLHAYREGYLKTLLLALQYSQNYQVPLFGLTDNPHTTDIGKIIKAAKESYGLPSENDIYTKDPLADKLFLLNYLERFNRTTVFVSNQRILRDYKHMIDLNLDKKDNKQRTAIEADFREGLCFYYTRTSPSSILRVEFPKWILDQDMNAIEEIHKIICAQCILGQGYPYAVNLAHQKAVLRTIDSDFFTTCVSQKARELKFGQLYSAKELNKTF